MDKTITTGLIITSLVIGATGGYVAGDGQLIELTDRQRYIEVETIKGNLPTFDLTKLSADEVKTIGVDAGIVAAYLGADLQGATEQCALHNKDEKCNLYTIINDQATALETQFKEK